MFLFDVYLNISHSIGQIGGRGADCDFQGCYTHTKKNDFSFFSQLINVDFYQILGLICQVLIKTKINHNSCKLLARGTCHVYHGHLTKAILFLTFL